MEECKGNGDMKDGTRDTRGIKEWGKGGNGVEKPRGREMGNWGWGREMRVRGKGGKGLGGVGENRKRMRMERKDQEHSDQGKGGNGRREERKGM
ncbi:hypothetical protein Tco_0150816 [Tanacetum coccineum]